MTSQSDFASLDDLTTALAATSPCNQSEEDRHGAARAALEALQPRDMIEAMLAARMIAAHHATMDGYRRAMQPETTDADSVRLRGNAIAAARSFDAALRELQKRQAPVSGAGRQARAERPPQARRLGAAPREVQPMSPALPDACPSEADAPMPRIPQYVPRNKNGEPVALWRWEDMTMSQRRAAYGDPADTELRAIALAEEEAMIEAENARQRAEQDAAVHEAADG